MSLINKMVLVTYTLLFTLLSAVMIAIATGWNFPLIRLQSLLAHDVNFRWSLGLAGAILLILGLNALLSNVKKPKRQANDAMIETTKMGEITITIEAIESLVKKTGLSIAGVKELKPIIKPVAEGVAIFVKGNVSPDVIISDTAEELQEKIRESIHKTIGVEVVEVKVLIEGIHREVKGRVE